MKRKGHIVGSVLLFVVVAAFAVAPAGLAAGSSPDAFERAVNARNASLGNPDAFERAVNARNASLPNPDAFERAVAIHALTAAPATGPAQNGPDLVVDSTGPQPVPTSGDAFDWASAAIGGSAMLVLVLLVGTIVVATRQRHRVVAH